MSNRPHNDADHEEYFILNPSEPNDSQQTLEETNVAAQPHTLVEKNTREEGLEVASSGGVNRSERHRRVKELLAEKVLAVEGSEGSSSAKKLKHNAKERTRRMRLNASYLALRALLPDSRRSKKRWTAPATVDKVLKYIPELENEIQNLEKTRDRAKNKQQQQLMNEEPQGLSTVSVNQLRDGEAILQICKETKDGNEEAFSTFVENMEAEQVCIKTASTLSICQNRICYQLHVQWDASALGADYINKLRHKLICWLS